MTISITEEYLIQPSQNHLRFTINFHGTPFTTTLTSSPKVVREWLQTTLYRFARFRHRLVVGLGVQWRPPSSAGKDSPAAATLQLCVGRRCLIFQLLHSPTVPNLLRRFLRNPNHTFVGMYNHSDAKKLFYSKHELEMVCNPLDLRLHAVSKYDGSRLPAMASRECIVRECLGFDVDFEMWVGRSEWDDYELDDDQILYASVDAYCSFLIGKDLRAWEL